MNEVSTVQKRTGKWENDLKRKIFADEFEMYIMPSHIPSLSRHTFALLFFARKIVQHVEGH